MSKQKCLVCKGRVRPPKRPWTETPTGIHFYETTTSMEVYARELARLGKKVPFVHELCAQRAKKPLPQPHMVVLDLEARLQYYRRHAA